MSVAGLERPTFPSAASGTCFVRYDERRPSFVLVSGEVQGKTILRLRDALGSAVQRATDAVVVDVSRVSSLDTAAVRALLAGRRLAAASGVDFVLQRPSPAVARLLACMGLAGTFLTTG